MARFTLVLLACLVLSSGCFAEPGRKMLQDKRPDLVSVLADHTLRGEIGTAASAAAADASARMKSFADELAPHFKAYVDTRRNLAHDQFQAIMNAAQKAQEARPKLAQP